ncbi:hypothetical protein LV779_25715 [Streptomyces thinghirensis]|nr:hypothetical protein [Streptomyces thinghirensis]
MPETPVPSSLDADTPASLVLSARTPAPAGAGALEPGAAGAACRRPGDDAPPVPETPAPWAWCRTRPASAPVPSTPAFAPLLSPFPLTPTPRY